MKENTIESLSTLVTVPELFLQTLDKLILPVCRADGNADLLFCHFHFCVRIFGAVTVDYKHLEVDVTEV